MPLLIEDGTGVEGANSYITVDELRTFALDRGVTFPTAPGSGTDPAIATYTPFLIRACDYIESKRDYFAGYVAAPDTQTLCFPRLGIATNITWAGAKQLPLIPIQLKNAQAQLVLEQLNGVALFASQAAIGAATIPTLSGGAQITQADGRVIIREKLDVIETQWSDTQGTQTIPIMPAVEAFLRVLYADDGRFFTGTRI